MVPANHQATEYLSITHSHVPRSRYRRRCASRWGPDHRKWALVSWDHL